MSEPRRWRVLGAVLAGGQSLRMGRDKALAPLAGKPLATHVVDRLRPQVAEVLLAGASPAVAAALGALALADPAGGRRGPLAGVVAALDYAVANGFDAVATAPCDAPFLPADLVDRLRATGGPAVARTAGGLEPIFALWTVAALPAARARLAEGEGPAALASALRAIPVDFDDPDAFANVNTPDDLVAAARWLAGAPRGA